MNTDANSRNEECMVDHRVRSFGKLSRFSDTKIKCSKCLEKKTASEVKAQGYTYVCKKCLQQEKEGDSR